MAQTLINILPDDDAYALQIRVELNRVRYLESL